MRAKIYANFISVRLRHVPIGMRRIESNAMMRKGGLGLQKDVAAVSGVTSGVHVSRRSDRVTWSKGGDEDGHITKREIPRRGFNTTHVYAVQACGIVA